MHADDDTTSWLAPDSSAEGPLLTPEQIASHAEKVMHATSEGILILEPDLRCEYINPAAEQMLGWTASTLIGRHVHPLLHPQCHDSACVLRRPFLDAVALTGETDEFMTRWDIGLPVDLRVSPEVVDGSVRSVVCLFTDATHRLQRERAIHEALLAREAAVEQLVELNAQRSDFVYTVSHELRTPLTSIMGFLDMVLEDQSLPDEARENLMVVDRNAKRLLGQVEALLLVSRIESGKIAMNLRPTAIGKLVEDAVTAIRPQADAKKVQLSIGQVDGDLFVSADESQIDRVLLNLLSNAVKFTPGDGHVRVTVTANKRWVQVQVEDSGMGIPEKEQHRLFQKFYRSSISQRRATPGTGLGLVIAKAIVEEHGGKIAVSSQESVGTAVAFTLPLADAASDDV